LETNPKYKLPEVHQKLPEVLAEMWRLCFTRQGHAYVSAEISKHYGDGLFNLCKVVYKAYIDSNGDQKVLQQLIDQVSPPASTQTPTPGAPITPGPASAATPPATPPAQTSTQIPALGTEISPRGAILNTNQGTMGNVTGRVDGGGAGEVAPRAASMDVYAFESPLDAFMKKQDYRLDPDSAIWWTKCFMQGL